jgi:hypothetical protein
MPNSMILAGTGFIGANQRLGFWGLNQGLNRTGGGWIQFKLLQISGYDTQKKYCHSSGFSLTSTLIAPPWCWGKLFLPLE